MNPKILNRDFQHPTDGWYQIEVKGNHPNRAAGVVQVIDDEACVAIVNRFNADAEAGQLSHGIEMLIDHEHFKHDADKETTAYGWLTKLENRADGYYGRIRWTNTGKPAVDGGDYRFFSTEYDPADLRLLNSQGKAKSVRPLRLDGLTLTNDPNNKGGRNVDGRWPTA
jgi:phage I-like protein